METIEDMLKRGRVKEAPYSKEMYEKEFRIGERDLESAKESYKMKNYKWATIQAYYSIFHGVRSLTFKAGYRESTHIALKQLFKQLYINNEILPSSVYDSFVNGMNLREIADYKETYSQAGAESVITSVEDSLKEIEKILISAESEEITED